MKLFLIFTFLLFLAVGSATCGGDFSAAKQAQGQSLASPVTDQASLISKLRAAGASVEVIGEPTGEIFDLRRHHLRMALPASSRRRFPALATAPG